MPRRTRRPPRGTHRNRETWLGRARRAPAPLSLEPWWRACRGASPSVNQARLAADGLPPSVWLRPQREPWPHRRLAVLHPPVASPRRVAFPRPAPSRAAAQTCAVVPPPPRFWVCPVGPSPHQLRSRPRPRRRSAACLSRVGLGHVHLLGARPRSNRSSPRQLQ